MGASHQRKLNQRRRLTGFFKKAFYVCLVLFLVGSLAGGVIIYQIAKDLPDVESVMAYIPAETTKIYSSDNVVLAELHREENRVLIPIEEISPILQKAVVALEDTEFYNHHGINIKGIMRALYRDILAGSFVEGGSTLTQQLARNLFLTKKKTISRKLAEMILAVQLERKYSKTEILEMYLNQVYWGHNAYGIESASLMYFDKKAKDLTLAESAMLVGMLRGPELYSPIRHFDRAKQRQKIALTRMTKIGLITPDMANQAYLEELVVTERKGFRYKAPYFTAHVIQKLIEMYGEEAVYTSGMKVYTTLNYKWQKTAEDLIKKYIEMAKEPGYVKGQQVPSLNYNQIAVLSLDPQTGYIKTMQGGVNFYENQFNRTTQAKRQPGSAFKPFVYLAALEKGFSPGTFIDDTPVTFNTADGPYSPQNYTEKFLGKIPLRKALEQSVNVAAIKLNNLVGPKNVVRVAHEVGIQSYLAPVLSLPLGASEVTMLELASAYGVFANDGRYVEPVAIIRIEDRNGIPLFQHTIREKRVFNSNVIATLVEMLEGVINFGTGRNAILPRPVAGKTGTTSDYRDAWFVGFVPQLVCAVWMGNDDNSSMAGITGGTIPATIWKNYMKEALSDIPAQDFPKPTGLVKHKVNWDTGKLAGDFAPPDRTTYEQYWRGKEPERGPDFGESYILKQLEEPEESQPPKRDNILDFFNGQ